ncbi:MAG: hypothetical protein J6Q82_02530 [Clostridia bacterium]|nr:hypothetical protein [Clostridia bacterium]
MVVPTSIMLYLHTESLIELLSDEEAGKIFRSIFEYARKRTITTELSVAAQVAFRSIQNYMDLDLKKYEEICQRNLENGKKGGRPRKARMNTQKTQVVFEKPYNNNNNNTNNNNNNNEEETVPPISPPSVEPPPPEEIWEELREIGIPTAYAEERLERAEYFARVEKKRVVDILYEWWQVDRYGTPSNKKSLSKESVSSENKSYDLEEFFEAALQRAYEETL